MQVERWHEVDGLFAEALDRPPAERPAFLEEACAGDSVLREEVERLLAADQAAAQFLSGSPGELLRLVLDPPEEGADLQRAKGDYTQAESLYQEGLAETESRRDKRN